MMDMITCYDEDEYSYISYGNLTLIVIKYNNYVNATRLCEMKGKSFTDWMRLRESKNLIRNVKEINKKWNPSHTGKFIIKVDKHSKNIYKYDISGYYVHQDLVFCIAQWISPSFAVITNKIINCYIYNEYEIMNREIEVNIKEIVEAMAKITGEYSKEVSGIIDLFDTFVTRYTHNNMVSGNKCTILTSINAFKDKYDKDIEEIKHSLNNKQDNAEMIKDIDTNTLSSASNQKVSVDHEIFEYETDRLLFFI